MFQSLPFFKRKKASSAPPVALEEVLDSLPANGKPPEAIVTDNVREAAKIAGRFDVPDDERIDIQANAFRDVQEAASDPVYNLKNFMQFAKGVNLISQQATNVEKVVKNKRIARTSIDLSKIGREPISLHRPVGLDFPQLRNLERRHVLLKSIVNTRVSQVLNWMSPSSEIWSPGFKITYKNKHKQVTEDDADRFYWMEQYLLNCGAEFDTRRRRAMKRDSLRDFSIKHLRSSLIMDSAPIELIPTLSGRTHGFKAVDGGTFFLVDTLQSAESLTTQYGEQLGLDDSSPEDVFGLIAREGIAHFPATYEKFLYPLRHPDDDENRFGYGDPEPETMIAILVGFLNALEVNQRSITHNSIPRGILNLFGDYEPEDIETLKADIQAQIQGVSNVHRMAVLVSSKGEAGGQFINTAPPPEEVMWSRWLTLQAALGTGLYQMDPSEVNFDSFKTSAGQLGGSDAEERLASSKDNGLKPLVRWKFDTMNQILETVDPELKVIPTGLEVDEATARNEEALMLTLEEYRNRRGEPAPTNKIMRGLPMNAAHIAAYLQVSTPQQPALGQPGTPPGQPGSPAAATGPTDANNPDEYQPQEGEQMTANDGTQYQNAQPSVPGQTMAKATSIDLELW